MQPRKVGIKELRNNLSRYLRQVRAGETLWVKDRDEVIAEIHQPSSDATRREGRLEAWIEKQERVGKLRRGQETDASLQEAWDRAAESGEALNVSAVLDEIRED